MRLTEEEIRRLWQQSETEAMWVTNFARRIERAVVEKWAKALDDQAEKYQREGYAGRTIPTALCVQANLMRASLEEKDDA